MFLPAPAAGCGASVGRGLPVDGGAARITCRPRRAASTAALAAWAAAPSGEVPGAAALAAASVAWAVVPAMAAAVADPFIKGLNSMPRVILAPIFAVWFGLGPASKIALGFTLVFFIVFFNVYQGVREVNPTVLNSARMLGANAKQLLKHVYLPSAMSWVFSSLHTSVGMAFVAAVIGEYLGSAEGVGYLILQAETTFDMNTVMAGILVLTACALVLDRIVTVCEKRLMRWQPELGR